MKTNETAKPWSFELGWLDGKIYDSILIFGVAAIALISGAIVIADPSLFIPVLLADVWLLGYHHVIATFTKLAGTKEDRTENRFLIFVLPFIVLAGVMLLYQFFQSLWPIVTVYFFWQWFHYTRQAYGIAVFYRRKATRPTIESKWLTHAAIWAIPIWGLLHRVGQGWDEFLFLEMRLPPVPERLILLAGIVSVGVVLWWLLTRIQGLKDGRFSFAQTAFVASHMIIFYVAYVVIDSINVGFLVANIWHNAQYILFVWLYNAKRFREPVPSGDLSASVMSWISQRKPLRILSYFCFTLVLTSIFYQSLSSWFQAFAAGNVVLLTTLYVVGYQTINFHHYVVDGLIWKARKKKHQDVMGLNA